MQTLEAELVQFKDLIILKTKGSLMVRQARVETRTPVQQGTQVCKGVGNKIKVQQKTGKVQ